tara:strand:+ start:16 stop:1017 length:1002 start_codon:yes stop_codon:yes gene_type:complete
MTDPQTRRKSSFGSLPFLIIVVLGLVIGVYAAYWFWMAGEIRSGAEDWVEDQERMGRTVEYRDLSVAGFPSRFVLRAADPIIDAPDLGARWEGEELEIIAMSWNLNHLLGRSKGENEITLNSGETYTLTPDEKSMASVVFSDGFLKRVGMEVPSLKLTDSRGNTHTATGFAMRLAPMEDAPENLRVDVSLDEARLAAPLPQAEWLGDTLSEFLLQIEFQNFYPVAEGRMSEVEWKLDRNTIDLKLGAIDMGPLQAAVRANVAIDRDNSPDGTVGVHLQKPDELKAALAEAGLLDPDIERGINIISAMSRDDSFATVKVKDREISLLGQRLTTY